MKAKYKNFKKLLNVEYSKLTQYDYKQQCLMESSYSWKGYPIIKKAVAMKVSFRLRHNLNDIAAEMRSLLDKYFNKMILNYDDLTLRQKKRLKPLNPEDVGEELSKYANIKTIRVFDISQGSKMIFTKYVICELK